MRSAPAHLDNEVFGLEPAAVAEGFVSQVVGGKPAFSPLPANRIHESDRTTHVQLGVRAVGAGGDIVDQTGNVQ